MTKISPKIALHDKVFEVYLEESQIEKRIADMADQISKDYEGKRPLFLSILNGSFMFAASLLKKLQIDSEISFVKVASYQGTETTGDHTELIGLNEDISNRHILILEDIVDTGLTIQSLKRMLTDQNPASLEVTTLFSKPEALQVDLMLKYVGFEIPKYFVVGFGMDYNGLGRNLSSVYKISD